MDSFPLGFEREVESVGGHAEVDWDSISSEIGRTLASNDVRRAPHHEVLSVPCEGTERLMGRSESSEVGAGVVMGW